MLGTHHDRFVTSHWVFAPVVGVLWVSKVDFSGKFLPKPKFGAMAERVSLDHLMTRPPRHSIWMWGTWDYPINLAATCTWGVVVGTVA